VVYRSRCLYGRDEAGYRALTPAGTRRVGGNFADGEPENRFVTYGARTMPWLSLSGGDKKETGQVSGCPH